ncbi:DUF2777 family protein [Shouchella lonarensis]|uniref:DUF2777 domain-containing protein n=1 Tax=Shouchella lonarensis TaxID=1464122 RepID=A0A1G6HBL5_9BACI|nr:DUF2777 family protein [Shouchella lonarensis]SDB91581.1 Protein of unknown function [Shouchella lonarensis]
MDRYEAKRALGQLLVVDLGKNGVYLGELLQVQAEPKKPWQGEVRIFSVLALPLFIFHEESIALHKLPVSEGNVITVSSRHLRYRTKQQPVEPFIDSILTALKRRYIDLAASDHVNFRELETLEVYIKTLTTQKRKTTKEKRSPPLLTGPLYIEYTFKISGERFYLCDKDGDLLELSPSSFEYTWLDDEDTMKEGRYIGEGVFLQANGQRYQPNNGATILIDQQQFDPYTIFQKELDPVALQGFEHHLQKFSLTHHDLIHCYNSLLEQIIYHKEGRLLEGVSFLTYQSNQLFVLVQHHFKRILLPGKSRQAIYDRFEFTTDKGKRTIAIFKNPPS